ncbi:AAA family ATPase [Hydrogenophilus thermoluteolus]|uniref:AAA+ ATPase domain-containing protein n=1 Tax=Hydrogenophilus thermoluteolus TaxID=297 RepID=A0A2Z6DY27_HYDTE|nr:AAA family ATPase [Hydrogenophilus thermoluteolus]BBD77406.1 hypothetical protein HPTL_1142 [Hydrogenophilus thermoluteolus]
MTQGNKKPPITAAANKASYGPIVSEFDVVNQFRDAIIAAGLTPPREIIPDGKLHRFSTNGKRGDDAGWYLLHLDGIPAGAFGDWRSALSETWRADLGRALTPEEEAAHRRRIEEARRQVEEERRKRAEQAARLAATVWRAAQPARPDHPYLARKKVSPTATLRELPLDELTELIGYAPQAKGELLCGRVLIAPVRVAGKIATCEFIDEAGRKSALAGGVKGGGFWATAALPDQGRIIIAEGVATALSIAEALGEPVAAALSVGNLAAAGNAIRAEHPSIELVIASDLDKATGLAHPEAIKAAETLNCPLVAPPRDLLPGGTDFNDLALRDGLEVVREAFAQIKHQGVTLLSAAEIKPEPIRWLWPGWLARGKLHLLAGRPGTGKSTLAFSLAATVTTGGVWPDGTQCESAGDVVVWSGEDDPRDTIAPRLMAAGADLRRVHFVHAVIGADGAPRPFDPASDMPRLAEALRKIRPALLILDPIVNAVAGDSHKSAEVRRDLQAVVDLAADLDCAVIGITHLSKGSAGRDPTERVLGSVAFAALARVVLLAAKNESKEGDAPPRILVRSKSNIGPDAGGVGYDLLQREIGDGITASAAVWCGVVDGDARQILSRAENAAGLESESGGELADAMGFLESLLENGGCVPSFL